MVSFIVPCYNYGHFLPECVGSILGQTHPEFEVLIMDDASSDQTAEVAKGFGDPRVVHIRNERNLGLNANINKGLERARGDYVWLMSADDKLRRAQALERYLEFMEKHSGAAFVFSPATAIRHGREEDRPIARSHYGPFDKVMRAPEVGFTAVKKCPLLGPSALINKSYLIEIGGYRLDLPRTADWYVYGALGMAYDVGYIAEPMACVRFHSASLDQQWLRTSIGFARDQHLGALQLLSRRAGALGLWTLAWSFQAQVPRALVQFGRHACKLGLLDEAEENFKLARQSGSQTRRACEGLLRVAWARRRARWAETARGIFRSKTNR